MVTLVDFTLDTMAEVNDLIRLLGEMLSISIVIENMFTMVVSSLSERSTMIRRIQTRRVDAEEIHFWRVENDLVKDEISTFQDKADIARSNMRTFERIVKCITENGDVYKLTSMMKCISYIRHFEPNYARDRQPNVKFLHIVLKSFKYFIQAYEKERSELEAFATTFLSLLYANLPFVRETYCRFKASDSWDKLTKTVKTKYGKIGSVGNNKLFMCISPLNSNWVYTGLEDKDTFLTIFHEKYNVLSCFCGEILDKTHKHKIDNPSCNQFEVRLCKVSNECCRICEKYRGKERYEDQWRDCGAYTICKSCEDLSEQTLPKECSCKYFIDVDGVSKCKTCFTFKIHNDGTCLCVRDAKRVKLI